MCVITHMTLTNEALRKHLDVRLVRIDPTWIAINEAEMHNLYILNVLIKESKRRRLRVGASLRRRMDEAVMLYQCFKRP